MPENRKIADTHFCILFPNEMRQADRCFPSPAHIFSLYRSKNWPKTVSLLEYLDIKLINFSFWTSFVFFHSFVSSILFISILQILQIQPFQLQNSLICETIILDSFHFMKLNKKLVLSNKIYAQF